MSSENHRDDLFDSLSNARRRRVLACLDANRTPISACELARLVAACETDAPEDGLPTQRVQRIYLALYHFHLPKLADGGVLDWDGDDLEVTTGPRFEVAIDLLDRVE
jgi:DNA-binding transcriptional ArsR family regulator